MIDAAEAIGCVPALAERSHAEGALNVQHRGRARNPRRR